MPTIFLRLDSRKLQNPNSDMRYVLPDLIASNPMALSLTMATIMSAMFRIF